MYLLWLGLLVLLAEMLLEILQLEMNMFADGLGILELGMIELVEMGLVEFEAFVLEMKEFDRIELAEMGFVEFDKF